MEEMEEMANIELPRDAAGREIPLDIRMSDRRLGDSIHMAFGLDDLGAPVHETLDTLADLIDCPGRCEEVEGDEH